MTNPCKLSREEIKQLIQPMGTCLASDRVLVDGCEVGYMYRKAPTESNTSGWTFLAGDEDDDYTNEPDHFSIHEVNTICNHDRSIIPHLDSPAGTAWGKDLGAGHFQKEPMPHESGG